MIGNFNDRYMCIYEAPGTSLRIGSYYFCTQVGRNWFVLCERDATYNNIEKIASEGKLYKLIAIPDSQFEDYFYVQSIK